MGRKEEMPAIKDEVKRKIFTIKMYKTKSSRYMNIERR